MKNSFIAKATVEVEANSDKVWEAITTPKSIKKYLMGTDVTSEWKEGSPIEYSGEYDGESYKDKGQILRMIPNKTFQSTYWSSMSGKEDKPENYNTVTYELDENDGKTTIELRQDNIATEDEQKHAAENWDLVLRKLKEVVES